jgi:hypothetical protein
MWLLFVMLSNLYHFLNNTMMVLYIHFVKLIVLVLSNSVCILLKDIEQVDYKGIIIFYIYIINE